MAKHNAKDEQAQAGVTGIGGVFFYAKNPDKTKAWYAENLGIQLNPWGGASFASRDVDHPDNLLSLEWKPFKDKDPYFQPSEKPFMINYRVRHLEKLVEQLRQKQVNILNEITHYDGIGKFVHIMDEEGNKIELWEPV